MNSLTYYDPPVDEVFEEIKQCAMDVWGDYDNTFGYVTEKVTRIKDIENVADNCAYIVAMFDYDNQAKLRAALRSPEAMAWFDELMAFANAEWRS